MVVCWVECYLEDEINYNVGDQTQPSPDTSIILATLLGYIHIYILRIS